MNNITLDAFSILDGKIYDPNGQEFIARGTNMFTWDAANLDSYLDNWSFNTIRVPNYLLGTANQPHPSVDSYVLNQQIVDTVTARNGVVIFSAHDRIGSYYEGEDFEILLDYWRDMARQHKDNPNVWFNLSNEPDKNPGRKDKWVEYHRQIIDAIRAEGANNLLIIDAVNWGQDYYDHTLIEDAINILERNENLVFSVHIYEQWGNGQELGDYFDDIQSAGIPIIVGEYGDVEATTNLLAATQERGIGRTVWVASANDEHDLTTGPNGDASHFDGTNTAILTDFGQQVWDDLQQSEELDQISQVHTGNNGQQILDIQAGVGLVLVQGFGGFGTAATPLPEALSELDTLRFNGTGLTVDNLILRQSDNDVLLSFEGVPNTSILLQDFQAEDLGNGTDTAGQLIGNIIFNGQTEAVDNLETVIIQGKDDTNLKGGSGNDLLRGGHGNDTLSGKGGDDFLIAGRGDDLLGGGHGSDTLIGGQGYDIFRIYGGHDGVDTISDYDSDYDFLKLWNGLTFADLTISQGANNQATDTLIERTSDNKLLAILQDINADTIGASDFITRNQSFEISSGSGYKTIARFGGVGSDDSPSSQQINEVDTLKFTGTDFTARNLKLTQTGADSHVSFIGVSDTRVILRDFKVQQFDNLDLGNGAGTLGNILFDGQTQVTVGIDVVANGVKDMTIERSDMVTFLNEKHNQVVGLDNSADIINAQGGNDTVTGGTGWDVLRGGTGDDHLEGQDGSDLLEGGVGDDYLNGGAGDDSLSGGAGFDHFGLAADQGTDVFTDFQSGIDVIKLMGGLTFADLSISQGTGAESDDTLIHRSSDQQVLAVVKNTVATNFSSTDFVTPNNTYSIIAGSGTTTLSRFGGIGTGNNPDVSEIAEFDSLQFFGADMTAQNLVLSQLGTDLRLTFDGAIDTEVILRDFQQQNLENLDQISNAGLPLGNVIFDGQAVATDSFDVFNTNSTRSILWDQDSVTFLNELDNTVVGFADSDDVINGLGGHDSLNGLSGNDILRGGAGNDTLIGNTGNDNLQGGSSQDTLRGDDGNDTLEGGFGNDSLNGDNGNDSLSGDSGWDTLNGESGDDVLLGGVGDDSLLGGADNDTLSGQHGNDTLDGGDASDLLFGGNGDDQLFGGEGDDALVGDNGSDRLEGGVGNDNLDGGLGNDELFGNLGLDTIFGSDGSDLIDGGLNADSLIGGHGTDTLQGGDGGDTLIGGTGNDYLVGGLDDDILLGEFDSDTLDGGLGDDTLTGGGGSDMFVLTAGNGTDTIIDYQNGFDVIGLSGGLSFSNLSFTPNFGGPYGALAIDTTTGETFAFFENTWFGVFASNSFIEI